MRLFSDAKRPLKGQREGALLHCSIYTKNEKKQKKICFFSKMTLFRDFAIIIDVTPNTLYSFATPHKKRNTFS